MSTTTYTHDETGKRVDVHRPSEINPGDYVYIGVDQARKALKEGQKVAGPGGTCHHCGKAIVWRVHFRYIPTGDVVTFGYICTQILEMSDNRIDHEMVLLKRAAENERKQEREKQEREDRARQFNAQHPQLAKFLNEVDENESFYFLRSLADSLKKWGSLTERQTESAYKIKTQREEYLDRKLKEAMEAMNTPEAEVEDLDEGRQTLQGTVIKHEWKYNNYGERHVMTVKLANGNKVWGSVPQSIEDALDGEDLKGKTIRFDADVTRSDRDEHFGFYKKPTKGQVI